MRKNFMEAFGDTQQESVQRIAELEAQLKEMRAKVKKEEDSRRHYQEFARKKDEEIKAAKNELGQVEAKYQEEVANRQRDKTLIM